MANSLFLGDYLTSEGQAAGDDLDMIVDGGFEIVGAKNTAQLRDELKAHRAAHQAAFDTSGNRTGNAGGTAPTAASSAAASTLPCGKPLPPAGHKAGSAGVQIPTIRRRGAGTELAPNA